MKVGWYLVTVLLGAFGALSLLRSLERLVFGGGQGSLAVQVLIGVVALFFAWKSLGKARAR
jgi:hypothetical protein